MVVLMNGGINGQNVNTFRYGSHSTAGMQNTSGGANVTMTSTSKQPLMELSRTSGIHQTSPLNASRNASKISAALENMTLQEVDVVVDTYGIHEMLASLALMCLLSLLMAFLALFFLQRTGPIFALPEEKSNESSSKGDRNVNLSRTRIIDNGREYIRVFQISVSLSTLTISLNLCCLFVCCIQFLSAIKLLKTPQGKRRTHHFLKKTSHIRVTAIGAFLISIPIFFTGVILFTFINFDEVPALTTSVIIGIGIVFCGVASVQNVYLWQCEKTKASQELSESRISQLRESGSLPPIELSTLV
ncbi:hypothetical protein B4U79_12218 [Dinothrombium tinctorium]|uniref:Uncharacterized protein n=1 Tax=Dinothrombium tinctorium TaxID=1965070 RepID=A0A3S3PG32_9ACAR|nr:hypothetical protein B4U79_12218 [Dinothrombium tinctorium]